MTKRVMVDENLKDDFLAGKKPAAKGKKRRTEIAEDAELEKRMTKKQADHKKASNVSVEDDRKSVGADGLRGVISETMARIYDEFWPGMQVHDHQERVMPEIAEEAYILVLTMKVGNQEDLPRMGLKTRDIDGLGDSAPTCEECAA